MLNERIIRIVNRVPLVYRVSKRLYWSLKVLTAKWLGTRICEHKWSRRGIEEVRKGFTNLEHPDRVWLMEQFDALYPFSSVLEIGCGYGANLVHLARRFPSVQCYGVDINPISVHEGEALLTTLGIKNIRLLVGKADDLSQFVDESIDIVFTDAFLYLIGPDKIEKVINAMKRISRQAMLIVELHNADSKHDSAGLGVFTPDGWVRDYRKLLNHFFSDDFITVTKIPPDIWPTGRWENLGYLITVMR